MTDFSTPRRMSVGAFFIYFLKYFKLTFNATLIFMIYDIFRSDGGIVDTLVKIASLTGCTAALALILASVAFFQIRFHVADGNLIYRHNLISRATTTIPLNRIHTLRTRQGILYRLLNLRGVVFDTLAAKGEEIELILSESDWQSLIRQVERQEKQQPESPDMPPVFDPSSSRRFSNKDLLLDALCQNHLKGMVILGGFIAAIFNSISDLPENSMDRIENYIEAQIGDFSVSVTFIALILAFTYLLSLVLWLGKVMLKYYDLSLTYNSRILTFRHGLFSSQTSRFARDKVCSVWIKRNYFEKEFGLCTLALKQALNSSAQKEEDNLKIYNRDCAGFFIGWWLGRDYGSENRIATAKSGTGVATRSILCDLILSSAATAILWHFGLYGWITLPAVYLLACVPKGVFRMRHSNIVLKDSYLIIGSGSFAEITDYLKYENVEVVRLTASPLTRFTGRVSLFLSSTGTSHTVRSLRQEEALDIYESILAKSNSTGTYHI